ncbi:chromate transporter [Sedimentibacter sp. zth1]|uniref:chromate transporter n=1 Tax=Sedimentibacter sp. zth1 TaxID=2816908 RepID=UPI001A93113D|nr:chromate transporter [Sedimentibacter sp. zth1]QSX05014.1 chromate transporter [Sedimentibacter sp. zth1]
MDKDSVFYKSIDLFKVFFKIGMFTFGGGYAMIPFIQKETVEKNGWISDEEILDIFAIAEATPGVIAVNTATFVGYKIAKFWGSIFATLGVILPSFFIILIISYFIKDFLSIKLAAYAFKGIRAGVVVLILGVIKKFSHKNKANMFNIIITILVFVAATFTSISTIYILFIALFIGIAKNMLTRKKEL